MTNALNPVSIINPNGSSDWLLVCEHASNRVPATLQQLGLADDVFERHVAYDIGAENMTRYLSEQLNATAVICNYSRLVIDCNRVLTQTDCIPPISDDVHIPANQRLTPAQRLWRIKHVYRPFHTAVFDTLCRKLGTNPHTRFANIHSFTPMLTSENQPRPWDIGFVHRNHALTLQIMDDFQQNTNYCIGDNEPYNGFIYKGYTVPAHADSQDIPSLLVEFRQDLIDTATGVTHWGDLLLSAMRKT